jgi:hypothetical protein
MPLLLDLLGFDEEVRNSAQYIEKMVEEDVGSQEIYETLRDAGLGKRKQTVLEAIRAVRGKVISRPYVSSLGLDNLPDPARFGKAIFPQSKRYSYRVKLSGINDLEEEPDTQYISIVTDKVITKREAINTAYDYMEIGGSVYNFTPKSAVVDQITVSPEEQAA